MRFFPKMIKSLFKVEHFEDFKIKRSENNIILCQSAKKSIEEAKPEDALNFLSKIENRDLTIQNSLIRSRLKKYQQDLRTGILTSEEKEIQFNRINSAILDTINSIQISLDNYVNNHKALFEYLENKYKKRLSQKLSNVTPIPLRTTISDIGTSIETSKSYVKLESNYKNIEVYDGFEKSHRRLLIIGNPGSGKSCLLLQLALELMKKDKFTLPIILNVNTWRRKSIYPFDRNIRNASPKDLKSFNDIVNAKQSKKGFFRLEDWLKNIIPIEFGITPQYAKKIIDRSDLILLLDGLDELSTEDGMLFLESLGRFSANLKSKFVLTARTGDYFKLQKDAPVNLQLEIAALTSDQIKVELSKIDHSVPGAKFLEYAIENSTLLNEVIKTPFYFNLLQVWFAQGMRLSNFNFKSNEISQVEREILHSFVLFQLKGQSNLVWEPVSCHKWLSFLAFSTMQRNIIQFELNDIQYDWWDWPKWTILFDFLIRTIIPFIVILITYLPFVLAVLNISNLEYDVAGSLFLILFLLPFGLGIFFGCLAIFYFTFKVLFLKAKPAKIEVKQGVIVVKRYLILGVLGGLVVAFAKIFSMIDITLSESLTSEKWEMTLIYLVSYLGLGTAIGYYLSVNVLFEKIHVIKKPYERFLHSVKWFHFSIVRHFFLRFKLFKKNLLPFKLVRFLNSATQNFLLESDDGKWQFRHRLFQEYFASYWLKDHFFDESMIENEENLK